MLKQKQKNTNETIKYDEIFNTTIIRTTRDREKAIEKEKKEKKTIVEMEMGDFWKNSCEKPTTAPALPPLSQNPIYFVYSIDELILYRFFFLFFLSSAWPFFRKKKGCQ